MTTDEPISQDAIERACAWSDYRKDYSVSADDAVRGLEHEAFKAGWDAAKGTGHQESVLR